LGGIGALMFAPVELKADGWLYGRLLQAILILHNQANHAGEFTAPIDAGTMAVFKVAGLAGGACWKLGFRKS